MAAIYRGPFPSIELPDDISYHDFLLSRMARHDQTKLALVDATTGRGLTYADIRNDVKTFACWLLERGFGKGQTLAIVAPNLPEFAVVFHGTIATGGTLTTVNPHYTTEEMQKQLDHSDTSIVFTVEEDLGKVTKAASGRPLIVFSPTNTYHANSISYNQIIRTVPTKDLLLRLSQVVINPTNDVAILPYSSGTTGLPKGVMLTHRNLIANILQMLAIEGPKPNEVYIGVLPLYHIYGMQCIMNSCLYDGAVAIFMPKYQLKDFLHACQHYGVTRAYLVPPIILQLCKDPLVSKYDLSKLRLISSGAAPLGPELQAECQAKLKVVIKQGYGLTETSPTTHTTGDDPTTIKPASVGPPVSNTECKLVDPVTGEAVGLGKRGEIWIRGPQVMKGYYKNEAGEYREMVDKGTRGCC